MTKQVTNKGYETYKKMYKEKQKSMRKRGYEMDCKMLTRKQWEESYYTMRDQLREDVANNERKAVGNVNQALVSRAAYKYSAKQARALKVAAKETGQDLSIAQIRAGNFDWNEIKDVYHELKDAGVDSYIAKELIGTYFFGSE